MVLAKTLATTQSSDLRQKLFKEGLASCLRREESLAPYTTLRVGGVAEIMAIPENENQMIHCYQIALTSGIIPRILGGGSNLLVLTPRIPMVISTKKLRSIHIKEEYVEAQSGALLPLLVRKAINLGLSGLESLVGIPGTLGGAIAGNAGSKPEGTAVEICDFIDRVTVIDKKEGQVKKLKKEDISFHYRNSSLREHLILSAVLCAEKNDPRALIERWQKFFRKKSQSQPFSESSAGCIFRNPSAKPAWKLICEAGLTGVRVGNAAISRKHANFIINLGDAGANEVWELINIIRDRIRRTFEIDLILEVQVW